jgi:hypothetical protein
MDLVDPVQNGFIQDEDVDVLRWEDVSHMPNMQYSTHGAFWPLLHRVTEKDDTGNYILQDLSEWSASLT